jgi:hypothetical protein
MNDVIVAMITLYHLDENGRTVLEVSAYAPRWLPVRPTVPRHWLRFLLKQVLDERVQAQNLASAI